MTRVNIGIPPQILSNAHLIAEHREIKRIPNNLSKLSRIQIFQGKFKMGDNHVRFFYDKGFYTFKRYLEIHEECLNRNINVQNFSDAWSFYINKPELFNDYKVNKEDLTQITQRLIQNQKSYETQLSTNRFDCILDWNDRPRVSTIQTNRKNNRISKSLYQLVVTKHWKRYKS
jgi:deoxyribonuclease (pyrimidine dimer)